MEAALALPAKILLVYPPFCPATTMPYSISNLKSQLSQNPKLNLKCIDLNAKFHKARFPRLYEKLHSGQNDTITYGALLKEFETESRDASALNNHTILKGGAPELFDEMIRILIDEKPDIVAMSIVYNSQVFYAISLIDGLRKLGIKCSVGGPATNQRFMAIDGVIETNQMIGELLGSTKPNTIAPDFSDYDSSDYFSKEMILPLKSTSTCFYQQCAFCTHHTSGKYVEYDIKTITDAICATNAKHVYFIDDMIPKKRLLEIACAIKPFGVRWWCQLRPTSDLIDALTELHESGLHAVCWGVESGSQKILDRMQKGTKVEDIKRVLKESSKAGIKNAVYIMFGFPGETKEDFLETISLLKECDDSISIISPSIFGLQKGSKAYENPSQYGIATITEEKRELLGEKITWTTSEGLQRDEARRLRGRFSKTLKKVNKIPNAFKDYKEQILLVD